MSIHVGGRGPGHLARVQGGFDPRTLFASGEKGGIWLPEYSDVAAGSGVGIVTDRSPNGVNLTQGTAGNKPVRRNNASTGFDYWDHATGIKFMSTAAINFAGTDAITVFTAVRKTNDTATRIIVELSATLTSNAGTFNIRGPSGASANNFGFASRGSVNPAAKADSSASYINPITAVLTGQGDISADTQTTRINGVLDGSSSDDQGTGDYGNYALFMGARNGATAEFGGHIYGLIVIGRTATATEIANVERMFATRCGATLA